VEEKQRPPSFFLAKIWGTPVNFEVLAPTGINLSKRGGPEKKNRVALSLFCLLESPPGWGLRGARLETRMCKW
jgi:hypothetical protein